MLLILIYLESTNHRAAAFAMKVFCIGSINIDHYYRCRKIVGPGESLPAQEYSRAIGGKGLNQAFALFKAGISDVRYHGMVGDDGRWMVEELARMGFPCEGIAHSPFDSGHTIIQAQEHQHGGENAVILYHGANHQYTEETLRDILDKGTVGDWLVIQGETNLVDFAIDYARDQRGMTVLFNPAPYPPEVGEAWRTKYRSDWIVVNRAEACSIARQFSDGPLAVRVDTRDGLQALCDFTGCSNIVVTLGQDGCCALMTDGSYCAVPSFRIASVADTTGAGDVFLGYFLACLLGRFPTRHVLERGSVVEEALQVGHAAAALAITRMGALSSIPSPEEVANLLSSCPLGMPTDKSH